MIIGILQAGHAVDPLRAQFGNFSDLFQQMLAGRGFRFSTYNVVDMDFPFSPLECDGWLITGSRHGAYEDHPFIPPLIDLIKGIYAADRPLIGVCFGHQIIAQALGGKVEKFDGGWAVGRQIYNWDGTEIALNAWHQDQVVEVPADAKVLGGNSFCQNAALVYGDRAFTVQPHPEFNADFVSGMIDVFRDRPVEKGLLDQAEAASEDPVENDKLAVTFARFFKDRVVA